MAVVLSQNLTIPGVTTLPPFPFSHARIGYETLCTPQTVTASSEAAGFPAVAAVTPLTYEQWRPEVIPATWNFDAGQPVDADYFGIAGHNFADVGAVVAAEYSFDGVDWVTISEFSPGDNSPVMFVFSEITARYWRVRIESAPGGQPYIGTIYIGIALAMQRMIYGGHSPIALSDTTVAIPTISDGGQFLGRSTIRKGTATTFAWQHLTADWYRVYFKPFAKVAREKAFFIAWRPDKFPDEVGFCWTTADIQPVNMGVRDFMSVEMSVVGLGD